MKCKNFPLIYFILIFNLNVLVSSSVYSQGYEARNWFSFLDKNSTLIGSGKLYFFGIELYEASFFSAPSINYEFPFENNFALSIKYSKSFSKERIANTSKKEILKLNIYNENDLNIWYRWMLSKFPDIVTNDILTAVFLPEFGLKLFHNNILVAENNDVNFAKAFFSIWMSKNTSEPKLRKKLFGVKN